MENNCYEIRVNSPSGYYAFYKITARNYFDAERMAKKQFCEDFGAKVWNELDAFTFNKYQSIVDTPMPNALQEAIDNGLL